MENRGNSDIYTFTRYADTFTQILNVIYHPVSLYIVSVQYLTFFKAYPSRDAPTV
jgi:hypothetical protein